MPSEQEIVDWVRQRRPAHAIDKIPGDASARSYYRVTGERNWIVMSMEPFADQVGTLPFLVVQKHLAAAGVDVPGVMDSDPARGFILLEDLGDVTLLRCLQDVSSPEVERHLYERVIDGLVQLQWFASPERAPAGIAAYQLRFDAKKLMWEVQFTIEHFYELHLGRKLEVADRKIMVDTFGEICDRLASEATVLTHRDFHSRNLMLVPGRAGAEKNAAGSASGEGRLVMIDFQDARMGPPQYDLASLLKDSYYQLEDRQVDRLLDYYIARWEAVSGSRIDRIRFREIFDLMQVQRNFKAIGSFASFNNRRGNPTYLKYIGNTFENIRRTLLKYPKYGKLREALFHYYYF